MVYTSSIEEDFIPGNPGSEVTNEPPNVTWIHLQNTFRNRPNATVNNYLIPYTTSLLGPTVQITYYPPYNIDNGTYFEIVYGYPRNHWIHKRPIFSLYSTPTVTGRVNGVNVNGFYYRSEQNSNTTIGLLGLEDGSSPVVSTNVGNSVPVVVSNNVINQ